MQSNILVEICNWKGLLIFRFPKDKQEFIACFLVNQQLTYFHSYPKVIVTEIRPKPWEGERIELLTKKRKKIILATSKFVFNICVKVFLKVKISVIVEFLYDRKALIDPGMVIDHLILNLTIKMFWGYFELI